MPARVPGTETPPAAPVHPGTQKPPCPGAGRGTASGMLESPQPPAPAESEVENDSPVEVEALHRVAKIVHVILVEQVVQPGVNRHMLVETVFGTGMQVVHCRHPSETGLDPRGVLVARADAQPRHGDNRRGKGVFGESRRGGDAYGRGGREVLRNSQPRRHIHGVRRNLRPLEIRRVARRGNGAKKGGRRIILLNAAPAGLVWEI